MDKDIILKGIILLASYLIGSVSPAYLIGKYIYGFDIRTKGSGNPGTTNAYRTMGGKVALVTLIFDVFKAALGAFLGNKFVGPEFAPYSGMMGILGHNFPFYLGFKGGKGVATSIGVCAYIAPKVLLFCAIPGLIVLFITKMVSAASVTGFIFLFLTGIYMYATQGLSSHVVVFIIISVLNIIRHKENIKRILNKTESKFGVKKWKKLEL